MQSMMWICRESRSGRISLHLGQACSGMFPCCCQSVPGNHRSGTREIELNVFTAAGLEQELDLLLTSSH